MSQRLILKNSAIFILALLWIYAAISKLVDWDHFKWEMHNQVLPDFFKNWLVVLLPMAELAVAAMLFIERTTSAAIWLSFFMLSFFTVYITLIVGHAFSYVPCSCGGILSSLSWTEHLLFNLVFIALTLTIIITDRKGGLVTKMKS